jgi:hypothetical protein
MTQASTRSRGHASKHAGAEKSRAASQDAIALLKADHREVADWFEQFEKSRSQEKKERLAEQICQALKVHTQIEEEIFYPAFLEATGNRDIHHEAEIEHNGAKQLIAQIEEDGPSDEYFESRMKVLSEMIKHHVKEEEQPEGMFAEARDSEMDLEALGEQLRQRKEELMEGSQRGDGIAFNG